jgi:uncharacterized membrane protein
MGYTHMDTTHSGLSSSVFRAVKLPQLPHWLWLLIVAIPLRLLNLAGEALWYDEAFTAWVSGRLDWQSMWGAIAGDVHPPLWYILEKVNIAIFGSAEWALRLPSVVLGTLAVLLLWQIGRELFDRRTAFIAGLLCAVMPAALYYS